MKNAPKNGNGSGTPARARPLRDLVEIVDAIRTIGEEAACTPRDAKTPDYHSALKALELEGKLLGYLGTEGGKVDIDQLRRVLRANGYELVTRGTS